MQEKRVAFSDALGHGMADRRIDILRRIGEDGSISQAARAVGVSYKAAWQAIDTLTNLAGMALVERLVGGSGGGGARLTDAGRQLLTAADAVEQARRKALAQIDAGQAGGTQAVARLAVRTSMRNQWPCVVVSLEMHGPIVLVQLRGDGVAAQALDVRSRITRESAELLGLAPGLPVQALCKATAVRVAAAAGGGAQPGPNEWVGRVTRVSRGKAGDEVSAQLDAGVQMVGFAVAGSGLRTRARVILSVDESAFVLAVTPGLTLNLSPGRVGEHSVST
ncbi:MULTISPECIES: TOBE domain-containing protein [unclassified Acidovorax]|uniref:TOBE domain-containing protein n=1 Tax=unclassified Acidovorax TaxID=2684926 RepID=UPI0028832560|nr:MULTISPECIES: TOBE domain-containing protein [unclassified Acidovorax]